MVVSTFCREERYYSLQVPVLLLSKYTLEYIPRYACMILVGDAKDRKCFCGRHGWILNVQSGASRGRRPHKNSRGAKRRYSDRSSPALGTDKTKGIFIDERGLLQSCYADGIADFSCLLPMAMAIVSRRQADQ